MPDANRMLMDILKYHQQHDTNTENIHRMRNAAPVSDVVWRYWHELIDVAKYAREFVDAITAHGVTIYVAINRDGATKAHLNETEAKRWIEDFPGNGSHIPRVETSQVFFK